MSVVADTKTCPRCETSLPREAFHKDAGRRSGLQCYCIECMKVMIADGPSRKEYRKAYYAANGEATKRANREYYHANREAARDKLLQRKFGITLDDYRAMLDEQSGVCAICSQGERATDKRTGRIRALAVDHCHESGAVRGLLCAACNQSLGLLEENEERMMNMIAYLEERS